MIKINITRSTRSNGSDKVSGYALYSDTKFTFSASKAWAGKDYTYALKASVIDPGTGKILQSTKKLKAMKNVLSTAEIDKLRKGQSIERLNAQATAYLMDTSDKSIKDAVEKLVIKLFVEHEDDIRQALNITADKGDLTLSTIYRLHKNAFFRSEKKTDKKVLTEKQKGLEKLCGYLSSKPVKTLTADDVKKAAEKTGKNPMKMIRLLDRFLDFCADNQVFNGINFAKEYLKSESKRKAKGKGQYRPNATHLTEKSEKKLHDALVTNMDDTAMAVALVKGYDISIDRLLTLTWGDLIINGDTVRIPDFKENLTGGTRNFVRPPMRETTELLLARYEMLRKLHGERKLKKMHIVNLPGSMTEKKAALSKAFRTMLAQAGIHKADMTSAGSADPKAAGGAGYSLLKTHYLYKLQHCLGVDPDSGVGCFLRGVRIPDVTSDYYRSLSDTTGDHFLQVIMRRDDGFCEASGKTVKISSETVDGTQTIMIPAGAPSTRTAVNTRKRVLIPAGSKVTIGAIDGVEGQAVFSETEADPYCGNWEELI